MSQRNLREVINIPKRQHRWQENKSKPIDVTTSSRNVLLTPYPAGHKPLTSQSVKRNHRQTASLTSQPPHVTLTSPVIHRRLLVPARRFRSHLGSGRGLALSTTPLSPVSVARAGKRMKRGGAQRLSACRHPAGGGRLGVEVRGGAWRTRGTTGGGLLMVAVGLWLLLGLSHLRGSYPPVCWGEGRLKRDGKKIVLVSFYGNQKLEYHTTTLLQSFVRII